MSAGEAPVVLAAGGTGGHMFPAEALARELKRRDRAVVLVTDQRGAGFGEAASGIPTHRIAAGRIDRGVGGAAKGVARLCLGWLQARRLLARLGPAAVVGFGGYPSVPTMLAATALGLPAMIHEQNAVLGRANRLLAHRVGRIATSFAEVAGIRTTDAHKVVRTGNPVRPGVAAAAAAAPYRAPDAGAGRLALVVIGGSQGARVLSDVVPEAVARLAEPSRARLAIVQQCRPEDHDRVAAAYGALGIAAELASFFHDLPARLASASLVITRAGASTITEIVTLGRPAILVPYPFAADDHQTANARALEAAGAAWVVPQERFTAETLADLLGRMLAAPDELAAVAAAARALAIPDAAARLAAEVEALIAVPQRRIAA